MFGRLRSLARGPRRGPRRMMGKRKRTKRSFDFGSPTGFRDKRGDAKDVAARAYARRSNNLTAAESASPEE